MRVDFFQVDRTYHCLHLYLFSDFLKLLNIVLNFSKRPHVARATKVHTQVTRIYRPIPQSSHCVEIQ
jgi:hypothetical protein